MPQVCLYFHLHQPYRLKPFNIFSLGNDSSYFFTKNNRFGQKKTSELANQAVFHKVAQKSYLPMLRLLNQLVAKYPDFKLAISCSGIFLEQAETWQPAIIELLKSLIESEQLEVITETYYHSLAFLHSKGEFINQIKKQTKKINQSLNYQPKVFRNTELIYANTIVKLLEAAGLEYSGILTEAVPRYLQGQEKCQVFASATASRTPLLLKHAVLSDDIAFRFSNRDWHWFPLHADRYLDWVQVYGQEQIVNLFMDFETFGEHQWQDTGIFEFFVSFVERFLRGSGQKHNQFVTPSEVFAKFKTKQTREKLPVYDVPDYISWADIDRDLTAWQGNQLQADALRALYALEEPVLASGDQALIEDWRRLQTSDHFYYMCTKWSADGDVHAYFSPYDSPLEAYRRYSVVLADLEERLL